MLIEKLAGKIEGWRPRTTNLLKKHGNVEIGKVTIEQAIGGARGVRCLVTDISYLDPNEGIRFRGMTIPETLEALPKVPGCEQPYVEGHIWLLLTGDVPTQKEVEWLVEDLKKRREIPEYVKNTIRAMGVDTHPMTMFSAGILALQKTSEYVKAYNKGIGKLDHWQPTLEDSLNLWAKLPGLGAFIYRYKYKEDKHIASNPKLDMGGDFASMMGIKAPYDDVARLYFILHSDHESGNVSAHAGHLVSSALSDVYYSYSAAINGLAGPLHGLANQEVLAWIQDVMKKMDNKVPSEDEMKQFVRDTLDSGQVIPGFGHAVLRKTDPRYEEQRNFCLKNLKDDAIFQYVDMLYNVVPPILLEKGKAKNPWPNVDAQSGVIQWHYGLTEYDFYTVLFGVGRSLGVLANLVWDRALGYPIERPKSLTTDMLEKAAADANN
jgi:citrate synthase